MKVIIYPYTRQDGFEGIAICTPTGELHIEEVLAKDCPEGAIIVDDSEFPDSCLDALQLVNGKVVLNVEKKAAIEAEKQAQATAKASALAKLTALGLTQAEVTALIG